MQRETVAQNLQCRAPFGARTTAERQANSRRDVLGCSRKEKNGSTTSKTKTVTTHAEPRFLTRRNNASEPSPASANRVRKKLARRPLTPKALSGTWHRALGMFSLRNGHAHRGRAGYCLPLPGFFRATTASISLRHCHMISHWAWSAVAGSKRLASTSTYNR